ncbi:MAG: cupin domain-containing protein [Pseudoflavonifractor sp.]|nr:cupin domain-containing protein [Pseudoflavonifractor sp.]
METIDNINEVIRLTDKAQIIGDRPKFRRVVGNDNGEVLLVSFDKGVEIPRHHVHCDVLVQVLEGEMSFTIYGSPDKHFDMKVGDFIRMAPDTEHSLRGVTPVKITVTKINA